MFRQIMFVYNDNYLFTYVLKYTQRSALLCQNVAKHGNIWRETKLWREPQTYYKWLISQNPHLNSIFSITKILHNRVSCESDAFWMPCLVIQVIEFLLPSFLCKFNLIFITIFITSCFNNYTLF